MKALVITEHGPPDVLRVEERPDPEPGPGEVRVRVRAAGVNFADLLGRVGLLGEAGLPVLALAPAAEFGLLGSDGSRRRATVVGAGAGDDQAREQVAQRHPRSITRRPRRRDHAFFTPRAWVVHPELAYRR